MPEITDQLALYLAARDRGRDDRVNGVVGALSDRERALFREAAVMGYVLGAQGGRLETAFPKDAADQPVAADNIAAAILNLDQRDLRPGDALAALTKEKTDGS